MAKADVKRQLILKETRALLVKDGGAGLSMRKVADASGISLGNLQYHFATREVLLEALLASFIEDYTQLLHAQPFQPTGNLRDDLAALLLGGLEALDQGDASRVFKALWAEAQNADNLAAELDKYYRDLADFYAATLGTLDPAATEPQISRAVSLLMPLMEGYCVTRNALPRDKAQLAQSWAFAVAAMLDEKDSARG